MSIVATVVAAAPRLIAPPHHDSDDQIIVAGYVVGMLDLVVIAGACRMCHAVDDDHTTLCPVPALEDWLAAQ